MANIEFDSTYVESLTKREMEVLELLASGASNQEIAAALVVELTTVKWYNTQIYDKLQVKNRRQAISRAQSLGILKVNNGNLHQQVSYSLPTSALPFIGRIQEIHSLIQQLTDENVRLVTILGAGGMGKTRLSIEVGRRLIVHFKDGVYFLPFAPVTSSEQIVTTIAEMIGFRFHSDKSPKQQLFQHFQKQQVLLIVDNFEHLLDSADFLSEILQHAPQVKLLVTSREKLNLAGERVHTLNGLSIPTDGTSATMADYDAVKLFADAAQRIGLDFKDGDMIVVARICQLLGGMPLAILLAAAWVDTLSIIEIEAEIKAGLGILASNQRDVPPRHQSIQAAFDTSWNRLSQQEQTVFMRLSVFRDGFTREAAQKVTGANVRDLQRLVHTSFIQLQSSGRYTIHELMRQYGEQKLQALGEMVTAREKHARYFAEFITPFGETSWGLATREMLATINTDFENVRTAWLFQAEQKNIPELRRFMDSIWHFVDITSRTQEGIELFQPLLNVFSGDNDDEILFRGQILACLAWCYSDTGHHQKAYELSKEALPIVQKYNSLNDLLRLYLELYFVMLFLNDEATSFDYIEQGFALVQQYPSSKWLIPIAVHRAEFYLYLDRVEEALHCAELIPENNLWHASFTARYLLKIGEVRRAEEVLYDSLSKYLYHRIGYLSVYHALAGLAIAQGNIERAWGYVSRGLQYGDDSSYAWGVFDILGLIVDLLIVEKEYTAATELLALIAHHPANLHPKQARVGELETILRTYLAEDEFKFAWERGKQLDLGDVITEYMER